MIECWTKHKRAVTAISRMLNVQHIYSFEQLLSLEWQNWAKYAEGVTKSYKKLQHSLAIDNIWTGSMLYIEAVCIAFP